MSSTGQSNLYREPNLKDTGGDTGPRRGMRTGQGSLYREPSPAHQIHQHQR